MKMHEFKLRLICGVNDLIDDYKLRISKYQKIEIIELKDSNII